MGLSDRVDTKDLFQMVIGAMASYGVYLSPNWVPTIDQNIPIIIGLVVVVFLMQYRKTHKNVPTFGLGKNTATHHLWYALGISFFTAFAIGKWLGMPMTKIMTATLVAFPGTVIVDSIAGD
jgi:hypothetical protein